MFSKRPAEHVGEVRRSGGASGVRKDQAGCQRWGSKASSSSSLAAGSIVGQAGEHVTVVDPGIVAVALAGGQEAKMDGRRAAAPLAPAEKPVAASDAQTANGVFAFVVVDVQPAVLGVNR